MREGRREWIVCMAMGGWKQWKYGCLTGEDAVLSGRGVYFLSFERGLEGVTEIVVDMGG